MTLTDQDEDTARQEVDEVRVSVERGPKSEGVLTVLRGQNPGALYTLDARVSVIGRSPDVQVPIADDALSRRHACITRLADSFIIEDLGSTNGTFVDGERVRGSRLLEDGCRIALSGSTVLHFGLHDAVELEAVRQTHALTVRDPLTGAFNRRHLEERLMSEAAFASRHGTPLSLFLLDIDHFKRINDEHGHAVGDAALRLLAEALGGMLRKEDLLARYGGEEFAVVARNIDRAGALQLAERMRVAILQQTLDTEGGPLGFTVSIGVSHCPAGTRCEPQRLFGAADRALYAAKDAGRDRVQLAPESELLSNPPGK